MGGPPVPELVLSAARRHLCEVPPPRGVRWVLTPGKRVPGGWYFVYRIERHPPSRRPPPALGFFPGYLVADDGSVCYIDERGLREMVESGVLG